MCVCVYVCVSVCVCVRVCKERVVSMGIGAMEVMSHSSVSSAETGQDRTGQDDRKLMMQQKDEEGSWES